MSNRDNQESQTPNEVRLLVESAEGSEREGNAEAWAREAFRRINIQFSLTKRYPVRVGPNL